VKKVGIFAYSRDDVLVPDLGEQRTAGHFQGCPPFAVLSRRHQPTTATL
jgi:hypothetical protein